MIDKSSRLPGDDFNPLLSYPFIIIVSADSEKCSLKSDLLPDCHHKIEPKIFKKGTHFSTTLCAIELKSLGLCELRELLLGIERIPSAKRIKTRKVNMMSRVRNMVDDEDFRDGRRECLGLAIDCETGEIEIWNFPQLGV